MRQLSILAPTRYPWRFNSPRQSRHVIENRDFLPLNRLNYRVEGITAFNPWPPKRFDLVHAFNRIPIGLAPYIIGFESHLPRAYGLEDSSFFRLLQRTLASSRCRGVIAISDHARINFEKAHQHSPVRDALMSKLSVRYPNLPVADDLPIEAMTGDREIRVSFVGAHFARKGGCVAIRLAELAEERGLPLRVTIVSALSMGGGIWTDPTRPEYFDDWRRRLAHPSITLHGRMGNAEVVELFRQSDFSLLTTFGDTFGYSALEAMAVGCPVIGTRQGALPEFIHDGQNGHLIDLPVNDGGNWVLSNTSDRGTPAFERTFTDEIERMARETLAIIERATQDPAALLAMRRAAHETMRSRFNSRDANGFWDEYYVDAVEKRRSLS